MQLWHTYFITSFESDFTGPADTQLLDQNGAPLKMVPAAFARDLRIEGSGKLSDGRVVNVSGRGYRVLPATHPWGEASNGRPLVPLRTLAVDFSLIPRGSRVYIRQFDGLTIPSIGGVQGFVHDGWFTADDTGGAFDDGLRLPHIDVFAGSRTMMRALERIFPTDWRAATNAGVGPGFDATVGGAASATGTKPSTNAPSGGGGWAVALSLVAMGVGAAIWLKRRRTIRPNPSEFLVRTVSYRPTLTSPLHLGSVWLPSRTMAQDFAVDLSRRNRARVVVEEVDGPARTVFSIDEQG